MTAPAIAPERTTTDKPPICHRYCTDCTHYLCDPPDAPPRPWRGTPKSLVKCAVCADNDLAMHHRRTCTGPA